MLSSGRSKHLFGCGRKLVASKRPPNNTYQVAVVRSYSSQEPLLLTSLSHEGRIKTITLNNPKKRNVLSLECLDILKSELLNSVKDQTLRVVILQADGGSTGVFSSGHNLKELTTSTGYDYHAKVFQRCTEVMTLVQDIPLPVIAQVRGLAAAAGCQLVASCDFVVASKQASFSTPGASVGLFCTTPSVPLAKILPRGLALKMLFTGKPISAQAAYDGGLVTELVEEEKLEDTTMTLASQICEHSRSVIGLGKRAYYRHMLLDRDAAYRDATDVMLNNLKYKDAQEGIKAFSEKRKPSWTHTDDKVD